ncbi:MAG: ABC transporter [Curvibacter sp. RIFCSPHIGHO2_12_FULL_63_18]|uniref:ABC transporter ATP-binding protein n=1 Tax=Rhodoferax sp. TaxID=50421 RepID=UPI0008C61915|nr:ATP-binding cassette domain-containing protein [Rhodoferax sp.]OGO98136.1 MAG: ABC transporter [Curvibacter sp. GWA2_63_95]OGP00149.1 MAG: ABC transporter [Curvibacter sp. RIFCSPHIGHO2_12_FULL_63_18]HCX82843.1 ABC transporter [Rhodoferax sp.]
MIQTRGLAYRYTGTDAGGALHFPDVDLAKGAVLLLSGPSGCGKSTWLALVAGLMPPTAGTLEVAGQPLQALRSVAADAWRAGAIGFLPQKLHLSAALTVQQNLAMAQWAAGQPEDTHAIATALAALGVAELAHRKPAQLSGGQAQRVALARAVLQQPRVLLADEPTASLDDEAAADAVGLLLATARTHGATLVIATHDARVAALIPPQIGGQIGFQSLHLLRKQLLKA